VAAWETLSFEGDLRVKPLQPPILPEPARLGEDGPEECPTCRKPVTEALWSDDHWRLDAVGAPLSDDVGHPDPSDRADRRVRCPRPRPPG
jgi:hypothetical protein